MLASAVSLALLAGSAVAQMSSQLEIDPRISFGRSLPISPDHRSIPHWHSQGKPKFLSDRVLLTDQHISTQKNALWSDNKNDRTEWGAAFRYLATGPLDGGTGSLNLWYVKDGSRVIGTNSIYTAGPFDGMAIVVDSEGGTGGMVRGFLNDGTKDFRNSHHIDAMAFGSCKFNYHNTHRIAMVSVRQTKDYFEVLTDGKPCFKGENIRLPSGNTFGLTANTADKPDVFELLSFLVFPDSGNSNVAPGSDAHLTDPYHPWGGTEAHDAAQAHLAAAQAAGVNPGAQGFHNPQFQQMFHQQPMQQMPDASASQFHTQQEQFVDIHDRVQGLSHQIHMFYDEMVKFATAVEAHQKELITVLSTHLTDKETMRKAIKSIEAIEHLSHDIRSNVHDQDFKFKMENLHETVMQHHRSLMFDLPEHMHGLLSHTHSHIRVLAFYIFLFQLILVASYVVYKRRKNSQPKKYV